MSDHSDELVFALVGAMAAGTSHTAQMLLARMTGAYGYAGRVLKLSDLIRAEADGAIEDAPAMRRIVTLQAAGTGLRASRGPDHLARRAVAEIAGARAGRAGRFVTIIDSLKRPEEIALLRRVYGERLSVFCVFAPKDVRAARMGLRDIAPGEIDRAFEIDEDEGTAAGQRVRHTAHLADFFLRNDAVNDVALGEAIDRFLEILFGTKLHTPTRDEAAMYAASAAARGSACLSRQVGAVIYSADGEQIGRGCNDVPRAGGGLYSGRDGEDDHRCFQWGGKVCHNDAQKAVRFDDVVETLIADGLLPASARADALASVAKSRLKDLMEFSRAVHAEMEAIISVARNGNAGLVGATMFSTTFPCHNCARHIVASGIGRVVYVEPYAKSLAGLLHGDAIGFAEDAGGVAFLQYEGVAPRNIDRLFAVRGARKASGRLVETVGREAVPIGAGPTDGLAEREAAVIAGTGQPHAAR